MAYTLFNSPRSLSSRSSWLRWSFPTSSSVQEFIGKSGSCICRSGLLPPRFNLPSAAAVSCTTRLLGRVKGVRGIGLPVVLGHHVQPHSPPGNPPKPLQPPLSLQELHMLLSFSFPFFRLFQIFLHSPEFDPHFISCRSLPLLTKNCSQLFLQLQKLIKMVIKQKLFSLPGACSSLPLQSCSSSKPQYFASLSRVAPSPPPLEPSPLSPFSSSPSPPPSPSPRLGAA